MKPLVYIVLVNYKGLEDTIECLCSLDTINYDNYRVVVVDNASEDGSYEALTKLFPMHVILRSEKNLGFSAGNNIGIRHALQQEADYVLLLNNDTTVDRDLVGAMVSCFGKHEDAGIVGGRILYYDAPNVIAHAGGKIDLLRSTTVHYGMDHHISEAGFNKQKKVGFISGCLMMISRQTIQKIGLLDEGFFMYYEDTDYCMRALDADCGLYYTPEAVIRHKVSRSAGGGQSVFFLKWNTRNRLVFMRRYRHKLKLWKYGLAKAYFYGTRLVRITKYGIGGHLEKSRAILWGIKEGREAMKENVFKR